MSRISDHLYDQQDAMTRMLERAVMLESPTDERHAVNVVADFFGQEFRDLGTNIERLPEKAFGDHLRITWGDGDRQILLIGHMDTVWPLGETKKRPFHMKQDEAGTTIATGPGIFDMKGGLVIGLFAVAALRQLNLKPVHRLVFLLNSDEEVGSPTSREHIEAEAKRSEAALVLEPSREGALVTWRKGVGRFELDIQGQASHSGAAHQQGVSALEEMAHQILRLEAMTDYDRGTTVNVGVAQGGSVVNVRPASAWANIDLRVTTAQEGKRMTKAIQSLKPVDPRSSLIVSGGMNRPPWEPSLQGDALFDRARRVGQRLGLDLFPAGTGGGSDGNFTASLGVPTLDGLGVIGNDAHALTEWIDLNSLPRRAALLAELLMDLGK
jgi:glutamate carboxypeptidase